MNGPMPNRWLQATGVRSHVVEPTVDRFMADLPRFMWFNELPVGSSSQFAQWCVFDLARQHGVTVLLDGQGADEIARRLRAIFCALCRGVAAAWR